MNWFLLQRAGFFVFLFLTIYFVVKKKYEHLLALYFFGMTFHTCYYYFFTIWFPVKIIALGMVCCLIFERSKRQSPASTIISPLATFFIGAVLLSDLIGICFPGVYAPQINRYIRMFNSTYTYLTTTVLLFMGLIMNRGFVKQVFPAYCTAVEIAIAFGLIHFVCLKTGMGFMPILRQDGSVNLEAVATMSGQMFSRVYGVSGEPKNLGFVICPYLLILLVMLGQGVYRINKRYHLLALFAGVFVLINTYSSAALINFFLAVPLIALLLPFPKLTYKAGAIITTLCVAACIWYLVSENNDLAWFFIKQLSVDLGIADERTVNLTQKHIRGRLAESILFLKESYGLEEDGCTLSIYLSREDLANLSNMTTSNAIRTLSNFAAEKIIAIDGRKIKIIAEDKLEKISRIG